MAALYDNIGRGYAESRRADSRIAKTILWGLADSPSVINVGAGTGSYEPSDRWVVAIEPAATMIRQRPPTAAPVVQASCTALPVRDEAFSASLAILTIHHWSDLVAGLEELMRSARDRTVIFTRDPSATRFWLSDYFPEILHIEQHSYPSLAALERILGAVSVRDVPIPHDCTDGFIGAYWRRPSAYLRSMVRDAISSFTKLEDAAPGLARLRRDLARGVWHRRYGEVLTKAELDLGYRLVIANGRSASF